MFSAIEEKELSTGSNNPSADARPSDTSPLLRDDTASPLLYQEQGADFHVDQVVVHTKEAVWGRITRERYALGFFGPDGESKFTLHTDVEDGTIIMASDGTEILPADVCTKENGFRYQLDSTFKIIDDRILRKVQWNCQLQRPRWPLYIVKQYGVGWARKGPVIVRLAYYTVQELSNIAFVPPSKRQVLPQEVNDQVITVAFHHNGHGNKLARIENGVPGKVVAIKIEKNGSSKVKVLLEDTRVHAEKKVPYLTTWLKAEKFLLKDVQKYSRQENVNSVDLYIFRLSSEEKDIKVSLSDTCAKIKALFELRDGPLVFSQEDWSSNKAIRLRIDDAACAAWTKAFKDELKDKVNEWKTRDRNEIKEYKNETNRNARAAFVLYLKCPKKPSVEGNIFRSGPKCKYQVRIAYYPTYPEIVYVEALCSHSHDERITKSHFISRRLEEAFNDVMSKKREEPIKSILKYLVEHGPIEYNLTSRDLVGLNITLCEELEKKFRYNEIRRLAA